MIIIDNSDDVIFIATSIRKVMLKARIHCETFLSEHFMKSSFRGISMSKFHCVCSSSVKYCVYREKISSDSRNLIALVLIDTICYSRETRTKKFEKTKTYLNETISEKQEQQKCIFSELLLTAKFRHYLRMNATLYIFTRWLLMVICFLLYGIAHFLWASSLF